jgi:hypothetical protein
MGNCWSAKRTDPIDPNVVEPEASPEGFRAEDVGLDSGMTSEVGPTGNVGAHWQTNNEPNGNKQIIVIPNEKKEQSIQSLTADGNSSLVNTHDNRGYLQPVTTDVYQARQLSSGVQGNNVLNTNTDYASIQAADGDSSMVVNNNIPNGNTDRSFLPVASYGHPSMVYNENVPNDYTDGASAPGTVNGQSPMVANDYVEAGTTQPDGHGNDIVVTENRQDKDGNGGVDEEAIVFEGRTYKKKVYDAVLGQYVYTVD